MGQRMRHRGIPDADPLKTSPPLWAWHSCGGWQQPPTRETIDLLLGLEPENRLGLCVVTLHLPPERFLLSRYGPWCRLLDIAVAGNDFGSDTSDLFPGSGRYCPIPWDQEDDLQASIMTLELTAIETVVGLDDW